MLKWNNWSPRLETVELKESPSRAVVFGYTYKSRRHHRFSAEISIPVPRGQTKKAEEIVSFFEALLNRRAVVQKPAGSSAVSADAAGMKAALGEALKPRIEQLRMNAIAETEKNKIRRGRFLRVAALLAAAAFIVFTGIQVFLYFSSRSGLEYTAEGHAEGIWELAVSGDGALIATASSSSPVTSDRSVRLLRASDGALLRVFNDDEPVSTLEFSQDGKRIAVGRFRKVAVFDVASGNAVCTLPILDFDAPNRLRFSADGRLLAGWGSAVYLWDCSTGARLRHERSRDGWYFGDAAFNDAGVLLTAECRDDSLRLKDACSGRELWSVITDAGEGPSAVCNIALSKDGALLAAQTESGTTLIDTKSGSVFRRVDSRAEGMAILEFSPGGTHLIHKAVLGEAKVWDVNTGACVLTAPEDDNPYAYVSDDGALCAVHCDGGLVKVYETMSGVEVAAFRHRESVIDLFPDANLISFLPDGRRLISVCERVHAWRLSE